MSMSFSRGGPTLTELERATGRSANLSDCCGKRLFRVDGGLTFRTFAACEGKLVGGESVRRVDFNAIFVLRFALATRG